MKCAFCLQVALTGKKLGLPKFGNVTADEPEQCNSQVGYQFLRSQTMTQTMSFTFILITYNIYFDFLTKDVFIFHYSCFDLSDTTVNTKVRTKLIDVLTPKDGLGIRY
jgi:hypothetical protein